MTQVRPAPPRLILEKAARLTSTSVSLISPGLRVTRDPESIQVASGLVNGYPLAAGQAAPVAGERALAWDQRGDQHHRAVFKQVRGRPGTVIDVVTALSAIVAAMRGSSPGTFCLTLPTSSAATSE
jgi:hypothetical protein